MADGRVGVLGGTVVYLKDAKQNDVATYWVDYSEVADGE